MTRKTATEIKISPSSQWSFQYYVDIWNARELLYIFAWRDLKVRYKQTVIGALWAVFQPLFQTFIFTFFFGRLAQISSNGMPYSLFVLTGLVFWGFFSTLISTSSNSLIENENIIKKVYFPRVILPFSKIIVGLVDFAIVFVMLVIAIFSFGYSLRIEFLIMVIIGLLISSVAGCGLSLLLSSVNVKYRDVRYALPFFLQMLIFLTPVIYPVNIVRPALKYVMAVNPMTGVVEGVRMAISGNQIDIPILGISALSAIVIFVIGFYYFRSTEKYFADIV